MSPVKPVMPVPAAVVQKPIPEAMQKLIPLSSLAKLAPFQIAPESKSKIFGKPIVAEKSTRQKVDFHTLATGKPLEVAASENGRLENGEAEERINYTSDSLDSLR